MANETNTDALGLTVPRPILDLALLVSTSVLFILVLLLGGGAAQGLWSDAILQVASLPLLAAMLYCYIQVPIDRAARWPLFFLCAAIGLPLLQLIPMPPGWWSHLPGRATIAEGFRAADITLPWLPISLNPAATWQSLLSMLPATALFLAVLLLDRRARRLLIFWVLAVCFISIPLDLLQMMGGIDSPLRFYAITNTERAVGFFANSNHNAAFLYCAIPFAAAWAIGLVRDKRRHRLLGLVLAALLLVGIIIGLSLTRSRAGLGLGIIAGLSCLVLAWRYGHGELRRVHLLVAAGGNLLAILIAFQFGFVGLSQRIEDADLIENLRWPVAAVTTQAGVDNMPLGTGLGTFVPVYRMFAPRTLLREAYVNHAHDDWLELWLEGGLPALALAAGFLVWFGVVSVRLWREGGIQDGKVLDNALARAASIAIILLLLHSIVDYPLRTTAMMALFAVSCALLIPRVANAHAFPDELRRFDDKNRRMSG